MSLSEIPVESLSQRELRNESGRVFRLVSQGQPFILTNHGVPVGRIVPLDAQPARLPIARPAKRVGGWAALAPQPTRSDRATSDIIDELRADRV